MLPTLVQIEARAKAALSEQIAWAREEFCLPKLNPKFVMVDKQTGPYGQARTLRSGGFQIKMNAFYLVRYPVLAFSEYKSYNWFAEVGGIETNDWTVWVDALIAHELAHVVQFEMKRAGVAHPLYIGMRGKSFCFDKLGVYEPNHGYFFRRIYRALRNQFVNHRVDGSAFTAPRKDFEIPDDFEDRMKAKGETPLNGIKVVFSNKTYTIVGRNPNNSRLFAFQVQDARGRFYRVKLAQLAQASKEVQAIVDKDPKLSAELNENKSAIAKKQIANVKSSMTKRRRAYYA